MEKRKDKPVVECIVEQLKAIVDCKETVSCGRRFKLGVIDWWKK